MARQQENEQGPTQIGSWKVKKQLASRLDKLVYLGEKNGQLVAIKFLKNADLLDEKDLERFAQEILNLQTLDHPNIPKVIDFDLTDAMRPWLATDYVESQSIQEMVEKKGPLSEELWWKSLKETTEVLNYVHQKGVYHRDISPSNILIANDSAKVIDFGLSYLENSQNLTTTGVHVFGTQGTVSPETLKYIRDPKMDVFSLGATFVFAGTGHFPFSSEGDSSYEWMEKVLYKSPKLEGLSQMQRNVIVPTLYKNTNDRISSGELVKILEGADFEEIEESSNLELLKPFLVEPESKLQELTQARKKSKTTRKIAIRSIASIGYLLFFISILFYQYAAFPAQDYLFLLGLYLFFITRLLVHIRKWYKGKKIWNSVVAKRIALLTLLSFAPAATAIFLAGYPASRVLSPSQLISESYFEISNRTQAKEVPFNSKYEVEIPVVPKTLRWQTEAYFEDPTLYEAFTLIDESRSALASGNADRALTLAMKYAKRGNPEAIALVGDIKYFQGKMNVAKKRWLEAAELNYPGAFWSLGDLEEKAGRIEEAKAWWSQGKLRNDTGSIMALARLELIGDDLTVESRRAYIQEMKLAATLGDVRAMYEIAKFSIDGVNGLIDGNLALYWSRKASTKGLNAASVFTGKLYVQMGELTAAGAYFKRAADRNNSEGMLELALLNKQRFGINASDCALIERAKKNLIEGETDIWENIYDDPNIEARIDKALKNNCPDTENIPNSTAVDSSDIPTPTLTNTKKGSSTATAKPTPSPSPSPTKSAATQNPNIIPKAEPSSTYSGFLNSEPISPDLQSWEIWGRAYLIDDIWRIPLTNFADEELPPINRVQFRDSKDAPFGTWANIQYKIVKNENLGSYSAHVDNWIIQLFYNANRNVTICPEFRLARVEQGLVRYIWNKTVQPCEP